MVAQSSLSLTFILLESSIMLLNWIADMIPLMPPTQLNLVNNKLEVKGIA